MRIANSAIEKEEIQDLLDQHNSTVAALLVEHGIKINSLYQQVEALLANANAKPPSAQVQVPYNYFMSVLNVVG